MKSIRVLAATQTTLGILLCLISIAALGLSRSLVDGLPTERMMTAYLQTLSDTQRLTRDALVSTRAAAADWANAAKHSAAGAEHLANGIQWWNTWMGKERFKTLSDAEQALRHASTAAGKVATDLRATILPDMEKWDASSRASLEASAEMCEVLRTSMQTLRMTIWIMGIGVLCISVVVLLSGLSLRRLAADESREQRPLKAETSA